ncbi:MAG: lysophospholipid acyltransferase family protein [Aeromicrobium erythreum]
MSDLLATGTRDVPAPRGLPESGLTLLRPLAQRHIRRRWTLETVGAHHVPESGPVILAANHIGWLDGPLLIVCAPRPAHALVKSEAFVGRTGRLLRFAGQLPLHRERQDTGAMRRAADALAAGQAVAVYPEGQRGDGELREVRPGVAWLALVSGAPVVPVAIFGTREPGAGAESRPPRGSRLDVVYGRPLQLAARPWPRTTTAVAEAADQVHAHLLAHLDHARRSTGRTLPGPLPEGATDV